MERPHTLIDLNQASDASAVETFAMQHTASSNQSTRGLAGTYRSLIPSQLPNPGEQYAFQVDLDKCSACKSCVSACHHMNGLSDEESWRRVQQWFGEKQGEQWIQTVTSACHHCVNPECMNGCPVGAYEKNPLTGIVKHLDDQCIGCEYCIWKCPYEVPRYHESYGIVRKCDMCSERLTNQVEPACVQACPHDAIRIEIANQDELIHAGTSRGVSKKGLYPGAPASSITLPSSSYLSKRPLRKAHWTRIDTSTASGKPHWPLVWMLLLTQWGIGILTAHFIQMGPSGTDKPTPYGIPFWAGTLLILGGLMASFFHLGQPGKAWRFFLGLKTSWLSREILLFNTLAACLLVGCLDSVAHVIPVHLETIYATTVVLCGWLSVLTSAMIYHDTKRSEWAIHRTGMQFLESLLSGVLICNLYTGFFDSNEGSRTTFTTTFVFLITFIFIKTLRMTKQPKEGRIQEKYGSNTMWVHPFILILLMSVGIISNLPAVTGIALALSTGSLFVLDLIGRLEFFTQSKAPVAEKNIQGGHA